MAARTVTGTVVLPGGTVPSHASVMIELIASTTGRAVGWVPSADLGVGGRRVLECDTNGAWSVDLQPNALIDPANTVYRVTYSTSTDTQWSTSFNISVPDTAGPHRVEDILSEASASMPSNALTNHINNASGAHAASAISFSPTGSIAATTTQAAVAEVATDAAAALAAHEADTTGVHGIADTSALVTTSTVAELVRDTMGTALVAGTNITITVDDPGDTITIAAGSGLATDAEVTSAVSTHAAVTSGVHGISAFGATLVDDASAAAARTTLGLVIGTDVQAQDAELSAIAGLTSAADRLPYFTGSGSAALATFTTAGRALVDDADATAQRTTLGLGTIATQAASAVAITGGSITGITDLAVADGGTGASTAADARTNLGLGTLATLSTITSAEITDGTITNADISASAAIAGTKVDAATDSARGTVELATSAETLAGSSTTLAVTPAAFLSAVRSYAARQGDNLWPDGFFFSGGLSAFTSGSAMSFIDAVPVGNGGLSTSVAYAFVFSVDRIGIDTGNEYTLSMSHRSAGTNLLAVGVEPLDIDGLLIEPTMCSQYRFGTSALTTLAAALNPGDTTVTLTDGSGWATASDLLTDRVFAWWPYINSKGYAYPAYTYSRNVSPYYASRSGNVLTLSAPWTGAAVAAGSPVANYFASNSYIYSALVTPTSSWTRTVGDPIGPSQTTARKWRDGQSFVRMVMLVNFSGSAVATDLAGLYFARL